MDFSRQTPHLPHPIIEESLTREVGGGSCREMRNVMSRRRCVPDLRSRLCPDGHNLTRLTVIDNRAKNCGLDYKPMGVLLRLIMFSQGMGAEGLHSPASRAVSFTSCMRKERAHLNASTQGMRCAVLVPRSTQIVLPVLPTLSPMPVPFPAAWLDLGGGSPEGPFCSKWNEPLQIKRGWERRCHGGARPARETQRGGRRERGGKSVMTYCKVHRPCRYTLVTCHSEVGRGKRVGLGLEDLRRHKGKKKNWS